METTARKNKVGQAVAAKVLAMGSLFVAYICWFPTLISKSSSHSLLEWAGAALMVILFKLAMDYANKLIDKIFHTEDIEEGFFC